MLHGELRDYRAMLQQGAVGRRDDRLRLFAHRGGERPVEIARTARRDEYGLQTMLHRCRLLDPLRCGGGIRVVWRRNRKIENDRIVPPPLPPSRGLTTIKTR